METSSRGLTVGFCLLLLSSAVSRCGRSCDDIFFFFFGKSHQPTASKHSSSTLDHKNCRRHLFRFCQSCDDVLARRCRLELSLVWKLLPFYLPYLIRSNFIKTTYDISLDSQISFLPLGFSPTEVVSCLSSVGNLNPKVRRQRNLRSWIIFVPSGILEHVRN